MKKSSAIEHCSVNVDQKFWVSICSKACPIPLATRLNKRKTFFNQEMKCFGDDRIGDERLNASSEDQANDNEDTDVEAVLKLQQKVGARVAKSKGTI